MLVIGSILLGIVVICGLISEGELGCMGPLLVGALVLVMFGVVAVSLLTAIGGGM